MSITDSWPRDAVVITGLGAVSACGWGAGRLWRGLIGGTTAIAPPRRFDTTGQRTHVAAEVPDRADEPGADRWLSRADRFALAAAIEACRDADVDPSVEDAGVFFGGSTAAMAEAEEFFGRLIGVEDGTPRLRPLASHQLNGPGDAVARALGVLGPVLSLSSACASGALAIGAAADALAAGEVDVALAGGADSLCRLTYSGFNALRAVDERPCSPFRDARAGLSLGEGAAVLVLETLAHARQREARPLARFLGRGDSCDAYHMTAPHPRGEGAAAAISAALAAAEIAPEEVGLVNAHGTGTPLNDAAEWHALEAVFGARAASLPVTSTKGVVGHLLGSSGAIEAVATVQCLAAGQVHPTPGRGAIDPKLGVDLVHGRPRPLPRDAIAVSTSFAFGGANSAVILAGAGKGRT